MTTWDVLLKAWDLHLSVIVGCGAVLGSYFVFTGWRLTRKAAAFAGGIVILLIALVSPLDSLGDQYLFSAHMLQHLLLLLIVPPLFLLGLPRWFFAGLLKDSAIARCERIVAHPVVAWSIMTGVLWSWHIPVFYDLAVQHLPVHILEHLMFLAASTIFWWPILSPLPERRYPVQIAIPYLLAGAAANAILGIILTFTPPGLYAAYVNPRDSMGILSLIRNEWGLGPAVDQQIGGILMWAPASLVYLSALMFVLFDWYGQPESDSFAPAVRAGKME